MGHVTDMWIWMENKGKRPGRNGEDYSNGYANQANVDYKTLIYRQEIFSMERQYHQLLLMALLLIQIYKITVDVLEFGILVLLQQDVLAHLQY